MVVALFTLSGNGVYFALERKLSNWGWHCCDDSTLVIITVPDVDKVRAGHFKIAFMVSIEYVPCPSSHHADCSCLLLESILSTAAQGACEAAREAA